MKKFNVAKQALKRIIADGYSVHIIEEKDFEVVYKGKNFFRAWNKVKEYKFVSVEVYRTTKQYIGYMFVMLRNNNEPGNIYEAYGDYLSDVLSNEYAYLSENGKPFYRLCRIADHYKP